MWPSIFRRRVSMSFMSIILHSALRLAVSAIVTVVPPSGTRMPEAARAHADSNCRSAVLSVAAPNNASLEVSNADTKDSASLARAGSSRIDVPPATLPIDWYFGPAPRRFVALVDVTSERRPIKLRVSVLLRSGVCQLITWQVVGIAANSQPTLTTTTPPTSTNGRAPTTTSAPCAKDSKKSPNVKLACP